MGNIVLKARQVRLHRYGHIVRMDEGNREEVDDANSSDMYPGKM